MIEVIDIINTNTAIVTHFYDMAVGFVVDDGHVVEEAFEGCAWLRVDYNKFAARQQDQALGLD